MSEQKPSEWWILKTPSGDFLEYDEPMGYGWTLCKKIHVIEKSAYDRLKDHADKLAEALEYATMPIACETQSLEEVIKTVKFYDDKIREVFTEYRKEFPK